MATQTPYFGLTKSGGTEAALIGVYNNNMDIIDLEIWQSMVRAAINLAPIYDETEAYVEGDYCTLLETIQQTVTGFHLYKCTTDTPDPAGTFDPSSWSEVDITSEMGHGGGGGGGHTYIGNDGSTAMTQRDNAQFVGAYMEDDSSNDITKVNVMRSMHRAEFEQLSEAEKQGIIYVYDETTGTDDKFQPVIYSTEEREIGVWVDGKPVYQKSYDNLSFILPAQTNWVDTGIPVTDIDADTYITGFIIDEYKQSFPTVLATLSSTNTIGIIVAGNQSNRTITGLTLRYTKSTDTPGSGQWTPQGVPAVHYSTDEKVIGTWIDGKPLYQKTVIATNLVSGNNTVSNGISNIESIIENTSFIFKAGSSNQLPCISSVSGWSARARDFSATDFVIELGSSLYSEGFTSASVTLLYTKSS